MTVTGGGIFHDFYNFHAGITKRGNHMCDSTMLDSNHELGWLRRSVVQMAFVAV